MNEFLFVAPDSHHEWSAALGCAPDERVSLQLRLSRLPLNTRWMRERFNVALATAPVVDATSPDSSLPEEWTL